RNVEETTALLRRAAGADPSPDRQLNLVRHLQQFVGAEAALQEIEALSAPVRGSFDILAIEAAVCGFLGDHEREIAIYRQLVGLNPSSAALWKTLGDALKTVGRTDEAIEALRKAIEARPSYGEAWWTLSNFKAYRFDDREIAAMRK